jgi:hypothetical protein
LSPSPPAPPDEDARGSAGPVDLLENLSRFLVGPPARLLLVEGSPGSGKTSLLRELARRLPEPQVRLAYRLGQPTPASGLAGDAGSAGISVMLLEARGLALEDGPSTLASIPVARQADRRTAAIATPGAPDEILRAIGAMASLGHGCLFVDAWDRSTESAVGPDGGAFAFGRLLASAGELGERLAQVPVSTVSAILPPVPVELKSMADGVLSLGWLDWAGPPVRLLVVEKLSVRSHLPARHLYSLEGGTFAVPARLPRGFVPPVVLPERDPDPDAEGLWPGSAPFAEAFGRLGRQTLAGLEMVGSVGSALGDALWLPLVAHVVATGGRAVVIPPVDTTPAGLYALAREAAPGEALANNLRILSASGRGGTGELPDQVLLPLPGHPAPPSGSPLEPRRSLEPRLPDAVHFLEGVPHGGTALYVAALDGLRAIAAVTRQELDARTFPVVVSDLARLPGFVGFGIGRSDDPLTAAMLPSLGLHLRLELRDGLLLLYAVTPAGPAYFVRWSPREPRYDLLRAG